VGIRKASIHHHFPTKANLAKELMARYHANFAERLVEIEAQEKSPDGSLRDYIALYRDALGNGAQLCLCVAFSSAPHSHSDDVMAEITRFQNHSIAWLERLFTRAKTGAPSAKAHATFALVQGAQIMSRAAGNLGPFDQATAHLT
jgi:TetR/AcrR family transcriptional repressor of nem operon